VRRLALTPSLRPAACLALAALLGVLEFALFTTDAHAATIAVTTTADAVAADGLCSLREAITSANTDSAPFAGAGECPPGDAIDKITLGAGNYVLTRGGTGEDDNDTGDLDILGTGLTIEGAGAAVTSIDANHIDRVLEVRPGRLAALRGVTIMGGRSPNGSPGPDVVSPGGPGAATGGLGTHGGDGGGILSAGTLTIEDSVVSLNTAGDGGDGGSGTGAAGGAGAAGQGGAGGSAGNGGKGGGIAAVDGLLVLTRSTVVGNRAGTGGRGGDGAGGKGGDATTGTAGDGGIGIGGDEGDGGVGGGIFGAQGVTITIESSRISANSAGDGGPGGDGHGGTGGAGSGSASGGKGGGGDGGDAGSAGAGGGIMSTGPITITRSLVDGNASGANGGGGNGTGGTGGASSATNHASGAGGNGTGGGAGGGGEAGGVRAREATITNSTISGNVTGAGGNGGSGTGGNGGQAGVLISNGSGGNGTGADGGPGGSGAGLVVANSGVVGTIRHDTITLNGLGGGGNGGGGTAGQPGSGGLGGSAGTAAPGAAGSAGAGGGVQGGAPAASPTLSNSIVSGNDEPSCSEVVHDGGHNLVFPDASCPGTTADPLLAPLEDNGGPTMTYAIGPGSPAFDAVPSTGAGCADIDQRGVTRPRGAACDIGAFEFARPEVSTGDATAVGAAGATLNGQVVPNGHATSYYFEYGTTTAYDTFTPPRPAGHGVSPVPVSEGVTGLQPETTYHYRLVMVSAGGDATGGDRTVTTTAGLGGDRPPTITSASVRPRVFAVKRTGPREKPVAGVKKGTTFRYTLSEAARVTFAIQRVVRRRGHKRNLRAKRFAAAGISGANRHRFSGRIGRRALPPGSYRATLVAKDSAGQASKPKRLTFRVVRG
jgi:CSLREA domain-containing protein